MKLFHRVRSLILTGSLLLLHLTAFSTQSRAAAGDVDLSFDAGSGINSPVDKVVVQPDGKILITGSFTTVRGLRRNGIARILPDGTGDATFDAGFAFGARRHGSLALQPDGKIILASEGGLIRLDADGGGETLINIPAFEKICYSWGSCSGGINALAVQPDDKILIGGWFTTRNGDATNYGIARILPDGTLDSGFSATVAPPGTGNVLGDGVTAIKLQPDGKLVIAGFLSIVNGVPRRGIARLHSDGRLDESFNPTGAINADVQLLETQSDGKVLVVSDRLNRLNPDGSRDTGFHYDISLLNSLWSVVAQPDGKILVAGSLSGPGLSVRKLIRLMPDGSLDQTFYAPAIAGNFITRNTVALQRDGAIVVGGEFSADGELRPHALERLHPDGSLDAGFRSDTGLTGSFGTRLRSVTVQPDGKALIGGEMVRMAGPTASGIARLQSDGTPDPSFSPPGGLNGEVVALQPDGKILVRGGNSPVSRLLPGGEPDSTFRAALDHVPLPSDCPPEAVVFGSGCSEAFGVTAMAVQPDGRILIGGVRTTTICFEECWWVQRHFMARLHADGRYDDTFSVSETEIRTLIIQPDGRVLVAGYFSAIDGQARPNLARLNPDGGLDAGFAPDLPGTSTILPALQPDGRILIGRDFYDSEPTLRHEIARLNADGSRDASFNTVETLFGSVYSIMLQPDGRIILAGNFTRTDGHDKIVRLHPDGSTDGSFNAGINTTGTVFAVAAAADGGIFIGGVFAAVNGVVRPAVAKLYAEPGGVDSFAAWVARFALSGLNATAGADPDRDGLPNAAELILGGNPATPDRWNRPAATAGSGSILFSFSRADESETADITLTVESGTNLVTWPAVFNIGPNTSASSPGVTIVENGTAPDTITVAIPAESGKALFARLKATIAQ